MPRRSGTLPTIPTGSMADISFLLLVFFLLVTAIRDDAGLRADLPPSLPSHDVVMPRAQLAVLVGPSGDLAVDGEPTPARTVRQRVAGFAGSGTVVLKSHREAPYEAYVGALDAVLLGHRDAGVPPRVALPQ